MGGGLFKPPNTFFSLNEVRPGRPEQWQQSTERCRSPYLEVSMKSGLEDRNNQEIPVLLQAQPQCLNEVRPGRPEQCCSRPDCPGCVWHVSMKSGLEDRNNARRQPQD